jgi:hypothetical protein
MGSARRGIGKCFENVIERISGPGACPETVTAICNTSCLIRAYVSMTVKAEIDGLRGMIFIKEQIVVRVACWGGLCAVDARMLLMAVRAMPYGIIGRETGGASFYAGSSVSVRGIQIRAGVYRTNVKKER